MSWWSRARVLPHFLRNVTPVLYWSPSLLFITTQLYIPLQISGRSMQPTLNPDSSPWRDIGIFDCVSGRFDRRTYHKGDIVALRSPDNAKHKLVKRIIAVEGELVHTLPPYPEPTVRVPEGHVWVQGDEPFHTDDSNLFGPVPAALIDSRLIWIIWPLSRFGRPPECVITTQREDAYRHAMNTFKKNRTQSAKVTFDGIVKY